MLYKLSANHSSFKTITFNPGLNIIIAERTKNSGEKASRNALGKTTFVEILDFCFGSELTKTSKLNSPDLQDWTFTLELEIANYHFEVTRGLNKPQHIYINPFCKVFPIELKISQDKTQYLDVKTWREFLGKYLFNVENLGESIKYHPSGRSILGYFIRKNYTSPFETSPKQKAVQIQANNAFVLNLLWQKSLELYDMQQTLDDCNKLISAYKIRGYSLGKLNSQITTLSRNVEKMKKEVTNFNVLPEYKNIQQEADILTSKIQHLNNTVILSRKKLEDYRSIIENENNFQDLEAITKMYEEASVVFNQNTLKTLKEVKIFNENIIKNRKDFLQSEIKHLEDKIKELEEEIVLYSHEKTEKMKLLSAHGALEEYSFLQENLTKELSKLENLKQEADKQQQAQKDKLSIKSKQDTLKYDISQDIRLNTLLKEEITTFNENSMELYDIWANLIVDTDTKGNYKYYIDREKTSEGIGRMDIFCYDLMLLETYRKNFCTGIDFLIHDSTLYDSVDSRQRAKAIELAKEKAEKLSFQYIFTINSDLLPISDFSKNFNYLDYIIRQLTDTDPSGSLLGITFSSPNNEENVSDSILDE